MIIKNLDFLSYIEILNQKHLRYFLLEKYNPKEMILKQDKKYASVYIIKSGITKCYLSDENGKEFIQEFFGEGMEFGELEVFSDNLSFCSIEAISSVEVYKVSHQHYSELLENDLFFNRLVILLNIFCKSMFLKYTDKNLIHYFFKYLTNIPFSKIPINIKLNEY